MNEESVLRILYAHGIPMTINEISIAYGRKKAATFDYGVVRRMCKAGTIRIVETPEKQIKYLPVDPVSPYSV